jgi:hypothetical protein
MSRRPRSLPVTQASPEGVTDEVGRQVNGYVVRGPDLLLAERQPDQRE